MADININAIAETLNNKMDKDMSNTGKVYLKTTYVNGVNGYRIWSDGYCEQWGNFGGAYSSWTVKTVTFAKEFKDTNYNVFAMTGHTSNTDSPCINTKTTTTFSCQPYNSSGNANWRAFGYLKAGTY